MEKLLKATLPGGQFKNVPHTRRKIMASIRGKDTKSTERAFRMALVRHRIGGWVTNRADLPGKPDIYFPSANIAIFLDGCFWHGCGMCGRIPAINRPFWSLKIALNRKRDAKNDAALIALGLRVVRIWEHELQKTAYIKQVIARLGKMLSG